MASGSTKKKADTKIVIVGEASVGKTTLILRYIEGKFQDTISTIGASFFLKQWGPYNAAIWDTAGEEKFAGLSSFYCRGASAAILAYDVCSEQSFEALRNRFIPLLEAAEPGCLKVVVGTKLDIATSATRKITQEQGLTLAKEINPTLSQTKLPYFETSSVTGQNVEQLFEYILRHCLPLDKSRHIPKTKLEKSTIELHNSSIPEAHSQKSCCA